MNVNAVENCLLFVAPRVCKRIFLFATLTNKNRLQCETKMGVRSWPGRPRLVRRCKQIKFSVLIEFFLRTVLVLAQRTGSVQNGVRLVIEY